MTQEYNKVGEYTIEKHTFSPHFTTLDEQTEDVADNRARFADYMHYTEGYVMNTFFAKPQNKLYTHISNIKQQTNKGKRKEKPWKREQQQHRKGSPEVNLRH